MRERKSVYLKRITRLGVDKVKLLVGGVGGGPQDYCVSPSPLLGLFGLELGWTGLGLGLGGIGD